MKKIIMILFLLMLLTGCTVKYNLEVNKDYTLKENFTIENIVDVPAFNFSVDELINYLNKKEVNAIVNKSERYIAIENEYKSRIDFNRSAIIEGAGTLELTSEHLEFQFDNVDFPYYFYDESGDGQLNSNLTFEVNIKVPFVVTSTNAHTIENSVYTWQINESNYREGIIINFDNTPFLTDKRINYIWYILGGIILIAIIVITKKIKNSNRM